MEDVLTSIKDHVPQNAILGTTFGNMNFDLLAFKVFGDELKAKNITLF